MSSDKIFNSEQDLFKVIRGDQITVMNSAQFALLQFQLGMAGKAEEAGFKSETDAIAYTQKIRSEKDDQER